MFDYGFPSVPVRRAMAGLILAAAVLLAGAMPAAAERMHLSYTLYFGYVPAIDVSADLEFGDGRYRIAAEVAPKAWIAWALPWTARSTVNGLLLSDGQVRPEAYRSVATWGSRTRSASFKFTAEGKPIQDPPPPVDPEREPVPEAMILGALDPVSAVVVLTDAITAGRGCPPVVPVYDGRRRFDLKIEPMPAAEMPASWYSAYAGPATVCQLHFVSLAGGYRGGERSRFWQGSGPNGERPPIELWLARPREGLPAVPIHATGQSILGWITLYLSAYEVKGN